MILSIETSTKVCSVALHEQGSLIADQRYLIDQSHSQLLPGIIDQLLTNVKKEKNELQAIALSSGPGSYTGLRIGAATAKGLCYALGIPMIGINTLDVLAYHVASYINGTAYIIPMIDARRMEVYLKVVNEKMDEFWEARAFILEKDSFHELHGSSIYLVGNGAAKCRDYIDHPDMIIMEEQVPTASTVGLLAWEKFQNSDFEDLAYFEPDYLKEFHTKPPSKKLPV